MDPHSTMARFRAGRSLAAIEAAQRALRTAVTTPTSETEARAGFLTVRTPRAQEHPRCVTLGADELHAILRLTVPRNWRRPERRRHLVACEALALALGRMGDVTTRPGPDAIAAARLASRELAKWLARHDRPATVRRAPPAPAITTVLAPGIARSHPVPPPPGQAFPLAPARKTPDQRWRNRTPEAEVEYLRLRLLTARLARPSAAPEQLHEIDRQIARLEARHRAAVAHLEKIEHEKGHQESTRPQAGRQEARTEIVRLAQPHRAPGQGDQQQRDPAATAGEAPPARRARRA
jgi:hypothetical protein